MKIGINGCVWGARIISHCATNDNFFREAGEKLFMMHISLLSIWVSAMAAKFSPSSRKMKDSFLIFYLPQLCFVMPACAYLFRTALITIVKLEDLRWRVHAPFSPSAIYWYAWYLVVVAATLVFHTTRTRWMMNKTIWLLDIIKKYLIKSSWAKQRREDKMCGGNARWEEANEKSGKLPESVCTWLKCSGERKKANEKRKTCALILIAIIMQYQMSQ